MKPQLKIASSQPWTVSDGRRFPRSDGCYVLGVKAVFDLFPQTHTAKMFSGSSLVQVLLKTRRPVYLPLLMIKVFSCLSYYIPIVVYFH